MIDTEKMRLPVRSLERQLVPFSILCGDTATEHSFADVLELEGLHYDPFAEVALLLDAPRGFALQILETSDLTNRPLVVATWNTCPEYVEDLWELQPGILLVAVKLREELPVALVRAMQGEQYRICPGYETVLTQVERRIFRLVARGYGNQMIADRLRMQLQTVKNMLATIYQKLGLRNRSEALLYYWGIMYAFESEHFPLLERHYNK